MGTPSTMEGWQYELDRTERPERVLPGTGRGVLSWHEDIDGTGICLACSLYAREMQPDSRSTGFEHTRRKS